MCFLDLYFLINFGMLPLVLIAVFSVHIQVVLFNSLSVLWNIGTRMQLWNLAEMNK